MERADCLSDGRHSNKLFCEIYKKTISAPKSKREGDDVVHGFSARSTWVGIVAVKTDRWRARRWCIFTWFLASAPEFAQLDTFPWNFAAYRSLPPSRNSSAATVTG